MLPVLRNVLAGSKSASRFGGWAEKKTPFKPRRRSGHRLIESSLIFVKRPEIRTKHGEKGNEFQSSDKHIKNKDNLGCRMEKAKRTHWSDFTKAGADIA